MLYLSLPSTSPLPSIHPSHPHSDIPQSRLREMADPVKRKRVKPKLDRRNAMKNIDYRPPSSITASPFDDVGDASPDSRSPASSFDLSPSLDRQTSFRVMGVDGEFDLIFQALGLSGPDDFAIPTAAWEAQKARSRIKKVEENRVSIESDVASESKPQGGGIKGVRPTVLSPPPVTLPPIVDNEMSTWDLLRSLSGGVDSSGEEDQRGIGENLDGVRVRNEGRMNLVSDSSCSSTTSHEDDESDVGGCKVLVVDDDSVYNVSPNGSFRRIFKSWQKGEILGKGSFGTVYEGFTDDGFFFAVKEVSLLDQGSQGKQSIFQLQQEISLLSQFEHENIVRYLGTDKDKSTLYIFLELVTKGSLARLYQKYRLRDSQVSSYTRQILSGLKYLHDRNVVHRDIKCANILVDANGSVKLADFGLAKATNMNDVKSSKGSPFWMAPEVVNLRNRCYGLAADIWSLGCTVLEMLMRQPPYSHLEGMQALFRIGRGEPPPVPESLSKDARDFILRCLQVNPNERPTAVKLLDHPFVKRTFLSPFDSSYHNVDLLMIGDLKSGIETLIPGCYSGHYASIL
ncbi:mitogen-activated protein kinase kinase kinase 1-like [Senna tora]|uniref:mitogen-activated protein kinase kinase kinase n=1 Tax=Senna tora TaxID=362788 RepID=A0A834XCI7_9FABA|nr:mitogen-activated protein kinase kinase kinase 1-like [Senna tora]